MRSDVGADGGPRPPGGELVPTTQVRLDDLTELTHALRAALLEKGEFLPSRWVEESATDLHEGRLRGWVLRDPAPVGLAFLSARPTRLYGHVHIAPGPQAPDRARRMLGLLRDSRPTPPLRLDVGLTGLTADEETTLGSSAGSLGEETVVVRFAMERTIPPPGEAPALPPGIHPYPVREVPPPQLAALDWAAFQATSDETLVADTVDEDERVLREIFQGLLGRFLDEASIALVDDDRALAGFLLTAEQTPRRAIFLDLVTRTDLRRRGVGRFLLTWGLRALSAFGYESVRLWVTESNRAARALYDGLGFRITGRALIYRFGPAGAGPPHPQRSR